MMTHMIAIVINKATKMKGVGSVEILLRPKRAKKARSIAIES